MLRRKHAVGAKMTEYHLPDWAMCVGVESYPWPSDFYQEALKMGVSKALPTALPYEPGQTRLVCLHPKACVAVTAPDMNLYDLAIELATEHLNGEFDNVIPLLIDAETGYNTLAMIESLQIAEKAGDLPRLESKYGLKWGLGFFMYVYITGLQYVAREGETELPPEWQNKGVEIVKVEYIEGENNV
jgi:hypothetical protein